MQSEAKLSVAQAKGIGRASGLSAWETLGELYVQYEHGGMQCLPLGPAEPGI